MWAENDVNLLAVFLLPEIMTQILMMTHSRRALNCSMCEQHIHDCAPTAAHFIFAALEPKVHTKLSPLSTLSQAETAPGENICLTQSMAELDPLTDNQLTSVKCNLNKQRTCCLSLIIGSHGSYGKSPIIMFLESLSTPYGGIEEISVVSCQLDSHSLVIRLWKSMVTVTHMGCPSSSGRKPHTLTVMELVPGSDARPTKKKGCSVKL